MIPVDLHPDLIPALAITVGPSIVLLAYAWLAREQDTPRAFRTDTVPASRILARLADEVDTGEIPRDIWGGVDRPAMWTVDTEVTA